MLLDRGIFQSYFICIFDLAFMICNIYTGRERMEVEVKTFRRFYYQ